MASNAPDNSKAESLLEVGEEASTQGTEPEMAGEQTSSPQVENAEKTWNQKALDTFQTWKQQAIEGKQKVVETFHTSTQKDYREYIPEEFQDFYENAKAVAWTPHQKFMAAIATVIVSIIAIVQTTRSLHYKETHPDEFGGYIVKDRYYKDMYSYEDDDEYFPNPCGEITCRKSRDILVDANSGWHNGCDTTWCRAEYDGIFKAISFDKDCQGCHFNGRVYAIGDKVDYEPDACGNTCYCRPHVDSSDSNYFSKNSAVYCSNRPCDECRWGSQTVKRGASVIADACTLCSCPLGSGKMKCARLSDDGCNEGCLFEGRWYDWNSCFTHPEKKNQICGCYADGTVACTAESLGQPSSPFFS